ncbi:MAG: hypothetical protein AABW47_03900 [Nanoarchaeota archaeon]
MKKIFKKAIVILTITLFVAVSLMLVGNKMKANAIKEQQAEEDYSAWLADNCKCLERDRIFCSEGFEIKGSLCYNEVKKIYTNRLADCSKYDCSGEIKLWNNETGKWK